MCQSRAQPGLIISVHVIPFSVVSCLPEVFPEIHFNKTLSEEILSYTNAALNLREEYKPPVLTLNTEAKVRGGRNA